MKKIHWNGFLKLAVKEYPKEVCGFLFSKNPYDPDEEWFVFPVKNISKTPEEEWLPDKKELQKIKRNAIKLGLTILGNIHTHPLINSVEVDVLFLPSEKDLKFARRFNDIIRGIVVVDDNTIYGIRFHDKFGSKINIVVGEE